MSATQDQAQTQTALTPSEIVVLRARDFAGKPGLYNDSVETPDGQGKVSSSGLARTAFAAAFLMMEQAGALSFEEQSGRQGIVPTTFVLAHAGPVSVPWPPTSIEARIAATIARQATKVQDLVFTLVEKQAPDPDKQAIRVIEQGLAARGLLVEEKTKRSLFTSTQYHMTEQAAHLAQQQPIDQIKEALDTCRAQRADLWKRLTAQIKMGLESRSATSD